MNQNSPLDGNPACIFHSPGSAYGTAVVVVGAAVVVVGAAVVVVGGGGAVVVVVVGQRGESLLASTCWRAAWSSLISQVILLPSNTTENTFSWVPGRKSAGWPRNLGSDVNMFLPCEGSYGMVIVLLDVLM